MALNNRPLVAHNAAFDLGVIRDACELCELDWPQLEYACTLVVGRRVWPGLTTYSLPFLAAHLGIEPAADHEPAADAACAAEVACRALQTREAAGLLELLAQGESKSAKLRRAEELRAEGREIEIIGEREFARMLEGFAAPAA